MDRRTDLISMGVPLMYAETEVNRYKHVIFDILDPAGNKCMKTTNINKLPKSFGTQKKKKKKRDLKEKERKLKRRQTLTAEILEHQKRQHLLKEKKEKEKKEIEEVEKEEEEE